MSFILWIGYIALLIWMLSPDHMHVLLRSAGGRRIVLRGAAVVTVGYLLSISCQLAALVLCNTLGFPQPVSYFAYSAVYVAFWLLEAEAFHRLQYKISIQRSLLRRKSLVRWLAISGAVTAVVLIYNAFGGMATKFFLVENLPEWELLFLKTATVMFQLRIPDVFLTVCYLVLYTKTMKMVIRAAEWGQ